ncbi:MAG: ZIP family metal transporter [Gemmatimonadetes bacterium]|nr:ZIP family metal transporter [Gemmatimonadota bacterium]
MIDVWAWTLGSAALVTLTSLVGLAFLAWAHDHLDRLLLYLVSLAAGVLLGAAFFHLIPEAIEALGGQGLRLPLFFLLGFLGFFFLERFLWAHHHGHGIMPVSRAGALAAAHGHGTAHGELRGPPARPRPQPVVLMSLVGSGLHHLVDGMIIAAAYLTGPGVELGLVTTGAVLLHAVPHEAGDFGILVRGGLEVRRAVLLNLLSTSATIVGAVVVLAAGSRSLGFADLLLPISAGNFVYIAAADLIPELRHHHDRRDSTGHALLLLVGVGLMLALRLVELG